MNKMILSTIKNSATNIKIHHSWFIFFFLVIWSLEIDFFPKIFVFSNYFTPFFWALLVAAGFFISVLIHVSGHILVEKKIGLHQSQKIVFPFGCVFPKHNQNYDALISIAIAGPLANIFTATLFHLLYLTGIQERWKAPIPIICHVLSNINMFLTVVNILPLPPFDGSAVLHHLFSVSKIRNSAEKIFSISRFVIFLTVAFGIYSFSKGLLINGIWSLLIAMCIKEAMQCDKDAILLRQFFKEAKTENFLRPNPVSVQADIPLHQFVSKFLYKYHTGIFPVLQNNHLHGFILSSSIKKIPKDKWNSYLVSDLTITCSEKTVINSSTTLLQAIKTMYNQSSSRLLVTDYNDISGVITIKDLLRYFPL
jgi:Zn-dependent protease/CBS domain-containing protein